MGPRAFGRLASRVRALAHAICPAFVFLIWRFVTGNRYLPNIIRPVKFREKVLCKMLFDRDPRLPLISDKLKARDYIASTIGPEYLTDIYAVWEDANDITFNPSWEPFFLKPNHGSGVFEMVENPADADMKFLLQEARSWMSMNYGRLWKEWSYLSIPPKIFAEKWIGPKDALLIDYKFFCFSGKPKFIQVISGAAWAECRMYRDLEWNPFEVMDGSEPLDERDCPRPRNLDEMIAVAAALSKDFDFLRVDLFNVSGKILAGELTSYPWGAVTQLSHSDDASIGSLWAMAGMTYLPANRLKRMLCPGR
jgi:TupA-like ATPgrasp